jgi:hypothetical protein
MPKKKPIPKPKNAENGLLDLLVTCTDQRRRQLTDEERRLMVAMLMIKRDPDALDIERLIPEGSFLRRVQRHFGDTDISYALPLFQTVMIAASWLTQKGACLMIPGVGEVLPSLWTIALAESGSSKTLAASRIMSIFGDGNGAPPVRMLPSAGTDAQWIVDLAENNGAYWFQDEVGKFFNGVLTGKLLARIKPWMLDAYSHKAIGNRLRSEAAKLEIPKPVFTFFGLSVFSTWRQDIDATSMLDGFCQRPNYVVAPARTDRSMFDCFLYFEGDDVAKREADLRELWLALCAQPEAAGTYRLNDDVLPYLRNWWSGLRDLWGAGAVPASFVRRVGFSVLRYLIVLHFLLGKSRRPVDLETAHLATRYAEFHLESTREMLQAYDQAGAEHVRKVVEIRDDIVAAGRPASTREIQRRLGKRMREMLPAEKITAITHCLDRIDLGEEFLPVPEQRKVKSAELVERFEKLESRLRQSERKRNERRLRELRRVSSARSGRTPSRAWRRTEHSIRDAAFRHRSGMKIGRESVAAPTTTNELSSASRATRLQAADAAHATYG